MSTKGICLLTFLALALAAAPPALTAETPAEALDRSAGWGVDRDSGRIAIDASLLVFWDPSHRTLVINPDHELEAALDVEAEIQGDGTWLMPGGEVVIPIRGEVKVLVGDEPEELRRRVETQVNTSLERVDLSTEIGAEATKTRIFSRCTGCSACPRGCDGLVLFLPAPNFKTCQPAWPWRTCKRHWRPVCPLEQYTCIGCVGQVTATATISDWTCGSC